MADEINCEEEQALEILALESIFVGEFELINEEPVTYEIVINADRLEEMDNFIVVKLKVEYPPLYPKVMPKFQFKNLSPVNFNLSDFNKCHSMFKEIAEEMVGEQMVYEIIENVRQYLIEKNDVFVQKRYESLEEKKIKDDNMSKKFIADTNLDYIPVNKATFSTWLDKFSKEIALQKEEERKKRTKEQTERDSRTSGKAYFKDKQIIIGSNIAFEEDDVELLGDQIEEEEEVKEDEDELKYYNEELFADEDIDDLELD